MGEPKEVRPARNGLVFVCRKCTRRAGAEDLRDTLKQELGKGVRVVRSGCLKLCPKGRVAVVVAGDERTRCFLARPGEEEALVDAVSDALCRPS